MKFGIFSVLECPDGDYQRAYKELLSQVEYAEELGFDSIWLAEHHGSPYGSMPSPEVVIGAISQITQRMRIGMAVSILPFYWPVRLAENFAMVDVLTDGRLDMGVGRGYQPREFKIQGVAEKQDQSREMFEEGLDILVGCWENESFSYRGKHYQIEDAHVTPRPVQQPRPPIYVAAISPETYDLVAKYNLNVLSTPTLMPIHDLNKYVVGAKKALIERGRPIESINFPMLQQIHLASNQEEAMDRTRRSLQWYFDMVFSLVPKGSGAPKGYEYMANLADQMEKTGGPSVEEFNAAGVMLLDNPESIANHIEWVRREQGLDEMICWMRLGGLDDKKVKDSMRLFAKEVMPRFKDQGPVYPEILQKAEFQRQRALQ